MSEAQLVAQATIADHPAHRASRRRVGRPTNAEAAGAWGLSQFDAPTIRAALDGYGVEELVRTLVKIARNDDVDDKGRLVVAPTARLKACEKIRELHSVLAATEQGVRERNGPDEEPEDDDPDDELAFLRD